MIQKTDLHSNVTMFINCVYVTAKRNRPPSYGFTQGNQRNLWTILDWAFQIPLKIMFSPENNL